MTAATSDHLLEPAALPQHETGWWAMLCVCGTEAAFFAYLITAYVYTALDSPTWPPPSIAKPALRIPLIMTVALVSSSGAMLWAERGIRRGNIRQLRVGLLTAIALGLVFLGLFAVEYAGKVRQFLPQTHAYASLFYLITGVHGAHVCFGVLMIGYVLARSMRHQIHARRYAVVSTVGLYWHFVDVVWLVILTTLYLSPRLA
jgi:heme/copper-type cytochrome/quinol oxidase subunit 3